MSQFSAAFIKGKGINQVDLQETSRELSATTRAEALLEIQRLNRPADASGVKLFFGDLYLATVWLERNSKGA